MKAGDNIAVSLRAAVFPFPHASTEVIVVRLSRIKGDKMWWSAGGSAGGHTHQIDNRNTLSFADRGITWAPAWREAEVAALKTVVALGPQT